MTDFLDRWAQSSKANAQLVAQETLIIEATEALWHAMENAGITQSELAERLGTTKGHVSQVLGGSRNMTLRTFSDLCVALNVKPQIGVQIESDDGWQLAEEQPAVLRRANRLRLIADDGVVVDPEWLEAA